METSMSKFLTVIIFFIIMFISFQITKPDPVTSNFSEEAPRFYVLGFIDGNYEMVRLTDVSKKEYDFHIADKEKVILDVGDIHTINVLENSENKQKIQFNYSNTYTSESLYEVSNNTITPIQYRMVSSIGYMVVYVFNFIVSIILAKVLSRLIIWLWKKRCKQISNK